MMRLCVIWIISCSLGCLQPVLTASELAVRINYVSQQKPFNAVLDHLHALTQLHSSIDSRLLKDGINHIPIDIHLCEASQAEALQALCHALNRPLWWHEDPEGNILFTNSQICPPSGPISNRMYTSTIRHAHAADALIQESMQAWLRMPKAGIGFMPPQRQWSASLNPAGHQRLLRLIGMLETGQSSIPSHLNPTLKRVLPLTKAIQAVNWSDAAQQLQTQLKSSVSLSHALLEKKQAITIPACMAETLPQVLLRSGVHAAWTQNVLCIGDQAIQSWEHPSQTQILVIPLQQYPSPMQKRIAAHCATLQAESYWAQDSCLIRLLESQQQLFLSAHSSVIASILNELHRIDLSGSIP